MLLSRRGFALVSLLAAAHTPALAALEQGTGAAGSVPPGQLLVAAPGMGDPRFVGTVMVMIQHGIGGALGVAIDRPMADRPIAELLRAFGEDQGDVKGGSITWCSWADLWSRRSDLLSSTRDYHPSATLVLDDLLGGYHAAPGIARYCGRARPSQATYRLCWVMLAGGRTSLKPNCH